jgi:hypothetical protein
LSTNTPHLYSEQLSKITKGGDELSNMNHLGQDRITALEKKLLLIIYSADQPATHQFSNLLIFILQESYHEYFAALWKTVNQEFKPGRLSETVL